MHKLFIVQIRGLGTQLVYLRREVSKNETFWHLARLRPMADFQHTLPGLRIWAFPRALSVTYIYGITTSFVVEPACATVPSPYLHPAPAGAEEGGARAPIAYKNALLVVRSGGRITKPLLSDQVKFYTNPAQGNGWGTLGALERARRHRAEE
jgi:hypothetical protein